MVVSRQGDRERLCREHGSRGISSKALWVQHLQWAEKKNLVNFFCGMSQRAATHAKTCRDTRLPRRRTASATEILAEGRGKGSRHVAARPTACHGTPREY